MSTNRLNGFRRRAFVESVLNDTPYIDYQEQINAVAQAALLEYADPKVRAVYDDPTLRRCLDYNYSERFASNKDSVHGYYAVHVVTDHVLPEEAMAEIIALAKKNKEQNRVRSELRDKLTALIQGYNTLNQARKALPEFEKYLQDEEPEKTKNLPVIANVVTDLMNAGWPKEQAA